MRVLGLAGALALVATLIADSPPAWDGPRIEQSVNAALLSPDDHPALTVTGPPDFQAAVWDTLADMPPLWVAWVERTTPRIEMSNVGIYGHMDGGVVYVNWPLDDDMAGVIVHETAHAWDYRACVVLGGPVSEARAEYMRWLYMATIGDPDAGYWRTVYTEALRYREAGLRSINATCRTAYDPQTGRSVPLPAWKLQRR